MDVARYLEPEVYLALWLRLMSPMGRVMFVIKLVR